METLKLRWLGYPLVELKGKLVKLETRKAAALLAYLSLTPGQSPREVLATMFWQEGNQQKALANLRRTLSSLNNRLPGWIEADRETISLKSNGKLWVDVEAFQQPLSQLKEHNRPEDEVAEECLSILDKTVELYGGDFLEGLNLSDSPAFDEWQFFQRDGLRQEFVDALRRITCGRSKLGQWDRAILCARRWMALDRLNESACRALMDLYARSGQRTAALHQYEEWSLLLKEQTGQVPEEETRQLYEQIRGREEAKRVAKTVAQSTSFPLLKTKLYVPGAPASRVRRPRLIARLGEVEKKALTIISAPAGFGKTTLLAEWIAQTSLLVAWLSLDNGDNDPYRFLSYLISALESINEGIGVEARQIMQAPQLVPPHIILASLMNDLGKVTEPFVMVLDDYQFITEHAVHETLAYLLDHTASNMHLVISTRADPPLQLGRLRAHDQLLELRTRDLRFIPEESTEFLNAVMRLGLTVKDIETLETRTEGWVVGLKMAALSLKGHENVSEFIHAFSGSHRYVLDYLVEEVLRRQPAYIQTFLLETSILEKLSGPLCDAILGEEWKPSGIGGQFVLEYLESSNLFVIPLDEQKQWYRYHYLFSDLLRTRLHQGHYEKVLLLNLRAAEWYESQGSYPEAITHSISAQEFQRAAGLLEQSALNLLARNELSTYLSWLDSLPINVIQGHPWLEIYRAWMFSRLGKLNEVEPLLRMAEDSFKLDTRTVDAKQMAGCIALVRANVANLRGHLPTVIEQTEKAQGLILEKNRVALDNVGFQLGYAYYASGELSKARDTWSHLVESAMEKEDFHTFANVKAELANLDKLQGKLHQAFQVYRESQQWLIEHSTHPLVFTAVLEIGMADSLREWNRLEEARQLVLKGIDHARAGKRPNTLCFGNLVQARILQALHDFSGAFTALKEAEEVIFQHALYPRATAQLETARVRLWLSQENLSDAFCWVSEQESSIQDTMEFTHELGRMTMARVYTAKRMTDRALGLLIRLAGAAEHDQRIGSLIEILTLQSMALQAQDNYAQAQEILTKSLCLSVNEGYIRIYLDDSELMIELLKSLKPSKLPPTLKGYVKRLLEAFPQS